MKFLPIKATLAENTLFLNTPDCDSSLARSVEFYEKIGYHPPWIGYYAQRDGQIVGSAAFKGRPQNGKVEIAYVTFERFRQRGFATEMCRKLVELSVKTDPSIRITAQTLPGENFSTRILRKNGFVYIGTLMHEEDGEIWEWEWKKA